ncbi:DUF6087 family protein [Streptomyces paromomycinus]|uniref:Uncharacterized protein n=1 Tax=Streptomyces paromomycinus TaxID=92743 RepID=A0A401VXN6_STREY|nr:DUF6087 family protein [Streptomyces paromomycinus]GCD41806.1 hypothetical protein GKJPGBOP_01463 [Streptomyces paromomycinus]
MRAEDEPPAESLEQLAARQAETRRKLAGRLRVLVLAPGAQRAAHLHPQAPRLILRHDGYQWTPLAAAANYAAAQQLLHGPPSGEPSAHPAGGTAGTGRHRKPA